MKPRKKITYRFAGRLLDLLVSLLALLAALPLLASISIAIWLEDKNSPIFRQTRAGKAGKPFTLYKFRTMKTAVDPFGPSPKSPADDRLTKVGVFLREYSLDELPQLFNVLKGDMSLVGPRPLYMEQMAEWNDRQKKRLLVKPGLTGLAQISGRAELTREEKLELDVQYVEKASLWLDLKIIFSTFRLLFGKKQIYEKKYSMHEHTRGENKQN